MSPISEASPLLTRRVGWIGQRHHWGCCYTPEQAAEIVELARKYPHGSGEEMVALYATLRAEDLNRESGRKIIDFAVSLDSFDIRKFIF